MAFNRIEKLRDSSHVRALSLGELSGLSRAWGRALGVLQAPVRVVTGATRSFPHPGDADRVRRLFQDDLATNRLGLEASCLDGQFHFAYSIVILAGRCPE